MFHALPDDLLVYILSTWVAENNEPSWHRTLSLVELAGGKPTRSALQACYAFPFTVSTASVELSVDPFHSFDEEEVETREMAMKSASYLSWLSQRRVLVSTLCLPCLPKESDQTIAGVLQTIGAKLLVLQLKDGFLGEHFWHALRTSCPMLCVLEVEPPPIRMLLEVLSGLPRLQDLTLHNFGGSQHDIDAIMQVGQRLVRFSVHLGDERTGCQELTHVLNTYPALDVVSMNAFCGYQRSEQSLRLNSSMHVDEAKLVLAACGPVSKLTMMFVECEEHGLDVVPLLTEVVSKYHTILLDFTLVCRTTYIEEEYVLFVPLECPLIRRIALQIAGCDRMDLCLKHIAESCKHLEYFIVDGNSNRDPSRTRISDMGLVALFIGCPALKEVRISSYCPLITFESLQAILDNHLQLECLHLSFVGFDDEDAELFRRMAREQHLLPVPLLVVT